MTSTIQSHKSFIRCRTRSIEPPTAQTLSRLLEEGCSIRTTDVPGADDLMMWIYAAMA